VGQAGGKRGLRWGGGSVRRSSKRRCLRWAAVPDIRTSANTNRPGRLVGDGRAGRA
jgi:hypothetical protein